MSSNLPTIWTQHNAGLFVEDTWKTMLCGNEGHQVTKWLLHPHLSDSEFGGNCTFILAQDTYPFPPVDKGEEGE
ncbi:hypothetical protein CRENBAI_023329 [Crenichthys baileyi]|uniref:Uncharacterized protein n=1 Tax=Crenichthys baileyi TaxID=28760 RepID=A0AAV9R5W4_9TELE